MIAQLLPAPAFAELTYLESLDVFGGVDLAHPTLRSLAIRGGTADFVEACATTCPAVTTLTVGQLADGLDAVLRTSWLARLTDLKIYGVEMSSRDVERLERALAGRKLASLSLSGSGLDEAYAPRLQALCDHLDFGFALGYRIESQGPKYVEHTAKPEWGRGTIVREADGKVEVEFASGKKVFKAGAPFLKRV